MLHDETIFTNILDPGCPLLYQALEVAVTYTVTTSSVGVMGGGAVGIGTVCVAVT